jgi:membrane-bound serine protease (ClpP class)
MLKYLALLFLALIPRLLAEAPAAPAWLEVEIGEISTASDDILETALQEAKAKSYAGLIIRLDTPGGALDATRNMVKQMMASTVPIIVWVGPSGSRAGSAGSFLTVAGHLAAMAPGTNIGAAHPVQSSGEDVPKEMDRKILNDTVAFMESIAKARGRNVDMARSFVATSVSITEQEALENNVIDLIAKDADELLKKIDGKTVTLESGTKVKLASAGAARVEFKKSLRQQLLEILTNPNLFYLLFMAGLVGLGYELTHPGIIFPGVVGGICMILALIATSVLPVSFGAAALILVGIGLLIAEAFMPTFGALGVGGLVALVLGSVFLVDPNNTQGLRVSYWAIAPGAVTVALAFVALGFIVVRARRAPVQSGRESMVGTAGTALADMPAGGQGQVRVAGSIWNAQTADALARGDKIVVTRVDGLTLGVKRG